MCNTIQCKVSYCLKEKIKFSSERNVTGSVIYTRYKAGCANAQPSRERLNIYTAILCPTAQIC